MTHDRVGEAVPFSVQIVENEDQLRIWNALRNKADPLDAVPFEFMARRWRRPDLERVYALAVDEHNSPGAVGRAWRRGTASSANVQIVPHPGADSVNRLSLLADELEAWALAQSPTVSKLATYAYDTSPEMIGFWRARNWAHTADRPVVAVKPRQVPCIELPPGVCLTSLAKRPDLTRGVYDTYRESWTAAPWSNPEHIQPFDEWWGNIERWPGSAPEYFFVATAGDEVIGYAEIEFGGMNDRASGWHAYTGVRPAAQGQGIATALKLATIDWAARAGVGRLLAANDEDNAAMRGINAKLGYEPAFSYVSFERTVGTPTADP